MSNISWSSLYNLSASDRQRIVTFIKDDSPKHQRLVESCSVNQNVEAAVSQAAIISQVADSSPAAVIDTATETAVGAPTVAFSPIVSPVVVPAAIAEPNPVSAHPIPVSIPTWADVIQELQSKFGIEQEIAFDAEVHVVEAAITQLTEWMNTDFAEQASAWVAKLQLFLENESALDSHMFDLEDTIDLDAPPPAPASIIPAPRINTAPNPRINLATNPRPNPMPPRLLSRPRQGTPPIVSRNLGPARPMGLVRRHRSEVTESPPNTPN